VRSSGNTLTSRAALTRSAALGAVLLSLLGTACKSDEAAGGSKAKGTKGEIMVFAAASLTDVFEAMADDFRREHPGVELNLNFAGSQSLRTQIENGARPQVFASANAKHLGALHASKLVASPVVFAHNELVIVVPADNPAGIKSLRDLPLAQRIVLADSAVPAGTYTEKMLANASTAAAEGPGFSDRVMAHVVSRENHVRHTLQKVVLGEADAAVVYATDAASSGDRVKTISISPAINVVASYPIATVVGADPDGLGAAFVAHVRSEAGERRLAEFGFRPTP